MTGYFYKTFSVELYKGDWIQRAIMPSDQPPTTEAKQAVAYWLASGRRKFNAA